MYSNHVRDYFAQHVFKKFVAHCMRAQHPVYTLTIQPIYGEGWWPNLLGVWLVIQSCLWHECHLR